MIGSRDIHIQADRPQIEIEDIVSFVGSPSTIHIIGVPDSIGKWHVEQVYVNALMPDNTIYEVDAVKTGKTWTATIPKTDVCGKTEDGLVIYADVVDERGQRKTGFVLGKTDVVILALDRTVSPRQTQAIRLVGSLQQVGDISITNGFLRIMTADGIKQVALS